MPWDKLPYLCVLAVLIAAGFGMPIPEDIPLLTGGYLCHRGLAQLPIMIAVGLVGALGGDFVLFSLGRRFGHHLVEHRFVRRLVKPARLLLAERLFARHGIKIVFAGRFMPGLRPMIFFASGVLKVRPTTFLAVNGFAACISVPALILLAYSFGDDVDRLKNDVRTVTHVMVVLGLIAGITILAVYWRRRQRMLMTSAGINEDIDAKTLAQLPPGGQPAPDQEPASSETADADRPGFNIDIPPPSGETTADEATCR